MRRWFAALLCAVALAATAGCGELPAGIDGDLTDEWAPIAKPVLFTPAADGCFDKFVANAPMDTYAPFDCGQRHVAEAFHVGKLTDLAAAPGAHANGYAAEVAADECAAQAKAFTGGDVRTGTLRVQPVLPSAQVWLAGARWFRCDLIQVDIAQDTMINRSGSLRDSLKGKAPMALRCAQPTIRGEDISKLTAVDCGTPHDAEFAGLWTAPDVNFADMRSGDRAAKGCRSVIARWAKVPDDGDVPYRFGYLTFAPTSAEWTLGIRSVQCFLWLDGKRITGSYRGAGTAKLPINYG